MIRRILTNNWGLLGVLLASAFMIIASPIGPSANRSVEDVALVFGLPIALMDTVVPYILAWVAAFFVEPKSPHQALLPFSTYSRTSRTIAIIIFAVAVVSTISTFASIALVLASYAYPILHVDWAILGARQLAGWFFAIAIGPFILSIVFVAGIITARYAGDAVTLASEQLPFTVDLALRLIRRTILPT